ncbi:hypothetical protein EPUL_003535 [Erysiphe pulchra]|uniref:Extracellular mutant protein 11 C-terminal domain-containing protein n=1 Tax=Erysiphe pulchra TaxID=225359 RepID=A0A2S4PW39_9PEZI|nr:hypothetical protein EPUL_003535 [Erysiphe pulchra]
MSSGRLLGFVSRPGRYESPYNSDRNAAQALKILPKSTIIPSGGIGTVNKKELGSGQVDQINNNVLSSLPNVQNNVELEEEHQLKPNYNGNAYHQCQGLDSIVDSDFDHTRTDSLGEHEINQNFISDSKDNGINFLLERQFLNSNVEQHQYVSHRDMKFPMRLTKGSRTSNIGLNQFPGTKNLGSQKDTLPIQIARTGRFQLLEQKNQNGPSNLKENDQIIKYTSEKRSHSIDSFSDVDQSVLDGNEEFRFEEAALNTTPSRRHQKNPQVGDLNFYNSNLESHNTKNNLPSFFGDYDDETLKKMTYADLEAQSWEEVPSKKAFSYPRELRGSGTSLETKIDFYLAGTNKEKNNAEGSGRKTAVAFYEQLTSKEWEEAGEIFMCKFTDLMQKLQEKRREKRELTYKFESMIQARERTVRSQIKAVEKKLQDMRSGGESLLIGSPRSLR